MIKILPVIALIVIAGCTKRDEVRKVVYHQSYCFEDTKKERAEFILQCITNANPHSDEEPEDWIDMCQDIAEKTICENIPVEHTQRCGSSSGCFWHTIDKKPLRDLK